MSKEKLNREKEVYRDDIPDTIWHKTFAGGEGVRVHVWMNAGTINGKPVMFHTVTITRRYKNKQGEWAENTILRGQDIPKTCILLQKAYEYIALKDKEIKR